MIVSIYVVVVASIELNIKNLDGLEYAILYRLMSCYYLCSHAMESDEEEDDSNALSIPSEEMNTVIRDLTAKLENLKTCYDLISKHGTALQRALTDMETGEDVTSRSKAVSERATLFRISSNAMINVNIMHKPFPLTAQQDWRYKSDILYILIKF